MHAALFPGLSSRSRENDLPIDALWLDDGNLKVGRIDLASCAAKPGYLEAVLAIAFGKRLDPISLNRIVNAVDISRSGDRVGANLRIALAGFSRVPFTQDLSLRLSMANALMDYGMTAQDLIQSLGSDGAVAKFDPSQPRVPAGSGLESGRWTAGSPSDAVSAATLALALRASPLLAADLGAATLSALAAFAETAGFAAALGVLFISVPNAVMSCGELPGKAGARYDYNQDEGLLRILDAAGGVLAAGHKDGAGVFVDSDTGLPFAREVGGTLVFDGAAIAAAGPRDDAQSIPRAVPWTDTDDDDPKLCPDPDIDQPGSVSASERAKRYQEQISRMINPQRPLPYGLAVSLSNPTTGAVVHYDECDERTGAMIEAKGPGFSGLLGFDAGRKSVLEGWLAQSLRQVEAAGARDVVWYFAERDAADRAGKMFRDESKGREHIIIKVQPAD